MLLDAASALLDLPNVNVVSLSRLQRFEKARQRPNNDYAIPEKKRIVAASMPIYLGAMVIEARRGSNVAGASRFPPYISQSSVVC